MKIGMLNCDHVAPQNRSAFGDYPDMFRALLPEVEIEVFHVCDGDFPSSAKAFDCWLIGGSSSSVYDTDPWIEKLKAFVRKIAEAGLSCLGICFGHQMLVEALGGQVGRAAGGWCVGTLEFEVVDQPKWMDPFHPRFHILMSCQDQVLVLPPGGKVLATNSACPNAVIQIGDHLVGIQGHPEFVPGYIDLLMGKRVERIGAARVAEGRRSLEKEILRGVQAQWLLNFISLNQNI